jgi:hypothetical protein
MSIPAALTALSLANKAINMAQKTNKAHKKQKQQKKSQGRAPNKRSNQLANGGQRDQFTLALSDPFHPGAMGCRVPDPFPFPTVTYHLHQTTVLGCAGTNTSGAAMFMPNPCYSLADVRHSIDTSTNTVTNTAMTRYNATSTNVAYGLYASTGQSNLNTIFETWRIVSWGIKISNLQPQLSGTGRVIIAIIPCGDTVPTIAELTQGSILNGAITYVTGVPVTALDSSSLLQLPSAMEFAVNDFMHGDIEISGMYTNTNFWTFKNAVNNAGFFTGWTSGDQSDYNASGVGQLNGFKDATRMVGGCAVAIYFEGFPAGATNSLQVESIYHLEGTPAISANSNTVPIPSGACKPFVGPTNQVERSLAAVSSVEKAVKFIDKGAHFLNKNSDSINSVIKSARQISGF